MTAEVIIARAHAFLQNAYPEMGLAHQLDKRMEQVAEEIRVTGTWHQSREELMQGARMAWRNSNRCIGRLYWRTLKVIDARHIQSAEEAIPLLESHLEYGFNKGDIRSVITVFPAQAPGQSTGPRIWNNQLISFAGHGQADGSTTGDPLRVQETRWFAEHGATFSGTAFDVLPLALQWPGQREIISDLQMPDNILVSLRHPEFDWFASLGVKWYALPVISDMLLEIGGVRYTAAPFNGWYMGTEIGSRNLCDADRYNLLPRVAALMGLDMSSQATLWKDRALVEVNRAVLFSFQEAGMKITNHHDASVQFTQFEETEMAKGRGVTADWSWIVPPLSASVTPVFHKDYKNQVVGPNFYYQDSMFKRNVEMPASCPFHSRSL